MILFIVSLLKMLKFRKSPSAMATDLRTAEPLRSEIDHEIEEEGHEINALRKGGERVTRIEIHTIDDMAESARGVVPGATWILGASQKALYNDRWKEAEQAFKAMAQKGKELRRRYQQILKDIEAKTGQEFNIPVLYFTQLLGLAMGIPAEQLKLRSLVVNPMPLLEAKGLGPFAPAAAQSGKA